MHIKDIQEIEIIKAFEECKTKKEISNRFSNKGSITRFVQSLAKKAKIKVDDYFPSKEKNDIKEKYCLCCGKKIEGKNWKKKKFCNSSCAAIYNNQKRFHKNDLKYENKSENNKINNENKYYCLNCNKEINKIWHNNIERKFCSTKCQHEFKRKEYIEKWKNGYEDGLSGKYGLSKIIRHYMLEKNHYKCEKCGLGEMNPFTNTIPLEIHHKDGNYKNNTEENLQVLCPSCHSLTETFKSHNKHGRKDRNVYLI